MKARFFQVVFTGAFAWLELTAVMPHTDILLEKGKEALAMVMAGQLGPAKLKIYASRVA